MKKKWMKMKLRLKLLKLKSQSLMTKLRLKDSFINILHNTWLKMILESNTNINKRTRDKWAEKKPESLRKLKPLESLASKEIKLLVQERHQIYLKKFVNLLNLLLSRMKKSSRNQRSSQIALDPLGRKLMIKEVWIYKPPIAIFNKALESLRMLPLV